MCEYKFVLPAETALERQSQLPKDFQIGRLLMWWNGFGSRADAWAKVHHFKPSGRESPTGC